MNGIHGSFVFTDFDAEGMLVEGFEELSTLPDIYNFTYYPKHVESYGYVKDVDWLEYQVKVPTEIPEKALRIAEIVLKKNKLSIVQAKKSKDLLKYAYDIFDVIAKTYRELYSFVPLTKMQVDFYIKQYFPHIVPDYVTMVVDNNNEIAGFVIGCRH